MRALRFVLLGGAVIAGPAVAGNTIWTIPRFTAQFCRQNWLERLCSSLQMAAAHVQYIPLSLELLCSKLATM
jgi:hypothetical protein